MGPFNPNRGRVFLIGSAKRHSELETAVDLNSWECVRSETPSGALRRVRTDSSIDLVILTPEGPLQAYTELCREIKFDARTAFVAVTFVLPPELAENRTDVFEARADDCIQLPASTREIGLRLSNALRVKRATDSLEDSTAVVTSLATAIEGRDAYTHGHVERVSTYSIEIGSRMGVDGVGLSALKVGGIVHDIGKVSIPDHILNKPGKLDDVEMELIKRHPIIGYHILEPLRTFREALPIVRWHHERPNGKGYPDGLEGDKVPLLPRIVAVADCFDALSTCRPYRQALPPPKSREILAMAAERGDLDPAIVATLLEVLDESADNVAFVPTAATIT